MAELQIAIVDESSLRQQMMYVWEMVCKGIKSGPVVVTLGRPKRSGSQNSHFHALIGDIAKQVIPGGQRFSFNAWKAMLVDQFDQEMQDAGTPLSKPGRVVPSLDGRRVVTVRPSTTDLKKREAAQFIEFLFAWGAQNGVTFTPPSIDIYQQYKEAIDED